MRLRTLLPINSLSTESLGISSLGIGKKFLSRFINLIASGYISSFSSTENSNGSAYVFNTPISYTSAELIIASISL